MAAKKESRVERGARGEMRDAEVLRANRELAAYFKGRRTEREARAALKIIKAFIRDRERTEPGSLRPLPGLKPPTAAKPPHARRTKALRRTTSQTMRHAVVDTSFDSRREKSADAPLTRPTEMDDAS